MGQDTAVLRLKTFSNELCQLCSVCSSEALCCSGGFAQYSVWFQNCIQRNKFSCRVTIAVVPLIALHDRPQAASREGNKIFHGLDWRSSASLCLSQAWSFQTTEFYRVWTWSVAVFTVVCFPPLDGDHSAGSSLAAGQILLCFQLQVSGNAGQPAQLQLGLEDKSKVDITAWGGCVTLSAGQVWVLHPSDVRDECSQISVFDPHRIFFFLYLLSYESLEVNLFCVSEEENKPCEKFCFMLPDIVVLGLQLSLRTELSAPWVSWERLKQCFMALDHPGVLTGCSCPGNLLPKDILKA